MSTRLKVLLKEEELLREAESLLLGEQKVLSQEAFPAYDACWK